MPKQKTQEEAIVKLIKLILEMSDSVISATLNLIRNTPLTKNHEVIIAALEKHFISLPACWVDELKDTIASVLSQKETAKRVVKYEGLLNLNELASFMPAVHMFLHPRSPLKLSISSPKEDSELYRVIISSDLENYLDDYLGPDGIFQTPHCAWVKKFTRIPALPKAKKEQSDTLTLPDGCILSFVGDRWWLEAEGADKHEICRSSALEIVELNWLKRILTNEAWADIIKPDQPLLQD